MQDEYKAKTSNPPTADQPNAPVGADIYYSNNRDWIEEHVMASGYTASDLDRVVKAMNPNLIKISTDSHGKLHYQVKLSDGSWSSDKGDVLMSLNMFLGRNKYEYERLPKLIKIASDRAVPTGATLATEPDLSGGMVSSNPPTADQPNAPVGADIYVAKPSASIADGLEETSTAPVSKYPSVFDSEPNKATSTIGILETMPAVQKKELVAQIDTSEAARSAERSLADSYLRGSSTGGIESTKGLEMPAVPPPKVPNGGPTNGVLPS